ncbi:membrane transporter [Enterobacter cloacae]|nr:membrane transporter [Enterobacter cloacae]
MQAYLTPLVAWHGMFIFAAVITLLPVLYVYRLNNTQLLAQLQQEHP